MENDELVRELFIILMINFGICLLVVIRVFIVKNIIFNFCCLSLFVGIFNFNLFNLDDFISGWLVLKDSFFKL